MLNSMPEQTHVVIVSVHDNHNTFPVRLGYRKILTYQTIVETVEATKVMQNRPVSAELVKTVMSEVSVDLFALDRFAIGK